MIILFTVSILLSIVRPPTLLGCRSFPTANSSTFRVRHPNCSEPSAVSFPCCHSMEKRAFQCISFALWWGRSGSNGRPTAYEAVALTSCATSPRNPGEVRGLTTTQCRAARPNHLARLSEPPCYHSTCPCVLAVSRNLFPFSPQRARCPYTRRECIPLGRYPVLTPQGIAANGVTRFDPEISPTVKSAHSQTHHRLARRGSIPSFRLGHYRSPLRLITPIVMVAFSLSVGARKEESAPTESYRAMRRRKKPRKKPSQSNLAFRSRAVFGPKLRYSSQSA